MGLQWFWDILMLRDRAYVRFNDLPHVFERGLLIILVVALLVGAVNGVAGLISDLRAEPKALERQQAKDEALARFEELQGYFPLSPDLREPIIKYLEIGIDIRYDIAELSTPFVRPVRAVFGTAGDVLSTPFHFLSGWMGYTLWVLLAAKILSGRAHLQNMLGMTALQFLPSLLLVLQPIPYVGPAASIIAFIWGVLIYIKATAVANSMLTLRGFLAVILPLVALIALILIIVPVGLWAVMLRTF